MPRKKPKIDAFSVRPLKPADWPALEKLFGPNGACGGCWCMYWRCHTRQEFRDLVGEPAHRALRKLVISGEATAVLAFEGDEAIGWCAVGPRKVFPLTETKRSYVVDDADRVWSVNCFVVRRDRRGRGVASALLRGATDFARTRGASLVEGYPVVPRRGTQLPAAFAYKGALSMFSGAGFKVAQRLYPGSPLVRLRLRRG